ncbi:HEAT repeat protein [Leptospira meyeri]|uniref:HEAT repeat protein n=1 Tax=Leptospira meyeri TaxID=29508 RepID=A0A4V3HIQ9_LEPME|nr:HEAT repeat protein [Leptospira meyeri]
MNRCYFLALITFFLISTNIHALDDATEHLERCLELATQGSEYSFREPSSIEGITCLGLSKNPKYIPILGSLLKKDNSDHVRFTVIRALSWMETEEVTDYLLYTIQEDNYYHARYCAALSFSSIPDKRAIPVLEKYIHNLERSERTSIIAILETLSGNDYTSLLLEDVSEEKDLKKLKTKANNEFKAGHYGSTLHYINRALELEPENLNNLYLKANALVYIKNFYDSEKIYTTLLESKFPDKAGVYKKLGDLETTRGNLTEANEYYRKGLDVKTRNPK